MKTQDVVILGRLGRPHGVLGWMRLISFTEPPENIFNYSNWLINQAGEWKPLALEATKTQNKALLIKLANSNSPEQARLFTNAEIGVPQEMLPALPSDEFYWSQLEGLTVINQENVVLGQVDHILATGANDVLVVKGEKNYLVPYISQVVLKIDLAENRILVDWNAADEA